MIRNLSLLILSILSLSFHSCYYDNLDEIHAADDLFSPCDTSGVVSYSADINPIMINSCGSENSCHQSGTSDSAIPLDNILNLRDVANDGSLMGSILHDASYEPMPNGGGSLSACSIQKIQAWINRGTPDN